jgi:hypothetical protein
MNAQDLSKAARMFFSSTADLADSIPIATESDQGSSTIKAPGAETIEGILDSAEVRRSITISGKGALNEHS